MGEYRDRHGNPLDVRWPFLLLIAIGCLNGWLGYLIRYRGQRDLLAGTSPAARARVAPWVGGWSIVIGLLCAIWGIGALLFPQQRAVMAPLMSGLLLLAVGLMLGGSARRAR
jgi:hypothetical protein